MRRLLPYPLVTAALLAVWLLVNQSVSPGHLLLGSVLAVLGSLTLVRLELPPLRVRRPRVLLGLLADVLLDVVRSNFALASLLLRRGRTGRRSGFITIPLELHNPYGLALLAAIISATPGTIWVRHNSARRLLLLHVFDLVDESHWVRTIKHRYERRLKEVFE